MRGGRAARSRVCLDCGNRPRLSAFVTHAWGTECPMSTIKKILLVLVLAAVDVFAYRDLPRPPPPPPKRAPRESAWSEQGVSRTGKIQTHSESATFAIPS